MIPTVLVTPKVILSLAHITLSIPWDKFGTHRVVLSIHELQIFLSLELIGYIK